jgi:hypothetical protein
MNCVRGTVARSNFVPETVAFDSLLPIAWMFLAFIVFPYPPSLVAQQNTQPAASQPLSPQTKLPAATGQSPGAGTQLQTGTTSGLNNDERLMNLLADHQYPRVQSQLGQLPPGQAQFYRGILANRSNDLKASIELLSPLVDQVTASGNVAHEKLLRMALAEDYLRLGDWAQAAQAYQALDARLHSSLSSDEQNEIEMPLKMLPLAKDNPPMSVDPCEPFRLQVSDDPLGLIDIPVFIDANSHAWILDPTQPFNLIDRSTAKEVGLTISGDSATIHTLTGRPIRVHATIIPRFTIGGRLTLRNMTAFVYDDTDYYFPHFGYQVEGVLGYPALAAMGRLTVSDNAIQVDPSKEIDPAVDNDRLNKGARFYLDGDEIIVALGNERDPATDLSSREASESGKSESDGEDERMYAIDAGSQQTYLTSRWFDEHAAEFNSQKTVMFSFPGNQSPPQPAYVAESVPLAVGNTAIELHYFSVLTEPLGSAHDDVYGVLGIDALDQLTSYTFDYRTMRFSAQGE